MCFYINAHRKLQTPNNCIRCPQIKIKQELTVSQSSCGTLELLQKLHVLKSNSYTY